MLRGQREAPGRDSTCQEEGGRKGEREKKEGEREREQRPPRKFREMRNNKRKRQRERNRTRRKEIKRNGGKGSESAHANFYVLPMHVLRVRGPILGSLNSILNSLSI